MKSDWNAISENFSSVNDHRESVFPLLKKRIQEIHPKKIMDYGCGTGTFAHSCSELPIQEIVLYDITPNMCALAKEKCSSLLNVRVEENAQQLPDAQFDVITFTAVWMCLSTHEICVNTLKDVHRLLKSDGHFIAAVTHPCFRNFDYAGSRTDFAVKDYPKDGTPFNIQLFRNKETIQFTDYHWTIGAMTRQLKEAGFILDEIVELPEKDPQGNLKPGIPWMILSARKN